MGVKRIPERFTCPLSLDCRGEGLIVRLSGVLKNEKAKI